MLGHGLRLRQVRHPLPDISVCLSKPSRPCLCWLKQQEQTEHLPGARQICRPGGRADGMGRPFGSSPKSSGACQDISMTHFRNSITRKQKKLEHLRWYYFLAESPEVLINSQPWILFLKKNPLTPVFEKVSRKRLTHLGQNTTDTL